jgi:hypothetical protein
MFQQRDDGFARVRTRDRPQGDLFGVSGAAFRPPRVPRRSKWLDRGIIPDYSTKKPVKMAELFRDGP